MKFLVLFTFILACSAAPNPLVTDTPAVQAERQLFQQLFKAAAAAAAAAPDIDIYPREQQQNQQHQQHQHQHQNQHQHQHQNPHQLQQHQHQHQHQHQQHDLNSNHQNHNQFQVQNNQLNTQHQHKTHQFNSHNSNDIPVHTGTQQSPLKWAGPFASTIPAGLPGSGQVKNTPEVDSAIANFARAYNAAVMANIGNHLQQASQKRSNGF